MVFHVLAQRSKLLNDLSQVVQERAGSPGRLDPLDHFPDNVVETGGRLPPDHLLLRRVRDPASSDLK